MYYEYILLIVNKRILGIDPGSRLTGFGIIEMHRQQVIYITSGCIRTHSKLLPGRLQEIYAGISQIIAEHQPTVAAIEQVFMHRNVSSALKLGQARGAAIVACGQLSVHEYAPTQVKQAVVGKGHAEKIQVQHMVKVLLTLSKIPQADAADALAIALCHAHQFNEKW